MSREERRFVRATGRAKAIWGISEARPRRGAGGRPRDYERWLTRFFDDALRGPVEMISRAAQGGARPT